MKIKTKYYFAEEGKYRSGGDFMILQDRQILNPLNEPGGTRNSRPFYYDDTDYTIYHGDDDTREKVVINRLITDANYTIHQREYLTRLCWIQKQKLLWMFRRHWLQHSNIKLHFFILSLIVVIAFVGYGMITRYF